MRAATTVALTLLVLAPSRTPGATATSRAVERTLYLMGTRATLAVRTTDRTEALRQLDRMVRSLERTEVELSTWRTDSILSAINRQPVGEPLQLPPPVCALWGELTAWHRETDGAFDPAIGSLIEAWGLREGGRRPSTADLAAAARLSGMAHVRLDAACRVTRAGAVMVDAGAFGKGEALRRLARAGAGGAVHWMVDLGGQIAVSVAPDAAAWPIAIGHPARRAEPVLDTTLRSGSLATSGASERSYEVEGKMVAHIIDPRTGRPVHRPESVTVWHADALAADILSTALYVMGPDEGLRYADAQRVAALFLTPAGGPGRTAPTPRASRAFRRQFPVVAALSDDPRTR